MSLLEQKREAINSIKTWQKLVSEIELTDSNVAGILKCLDFDYMYEAVNELKILNGYLFSEENKPYFMDMLQNQTDNRTLIEGERQRLIELLSCSSEKYLEFLLISVKEKIHKRNEVFTTENETKFYQIMNIVGKINIEATRKFQHLLHI